MLLACVLVLTTSVRIANPGEEAVAGLVARLLPNHTTLFQFETIPSDKNQDVFEIESHGNQIVLRGNSGVSLASALNYYLKYYCYCSVSWGADNLNIPNPPPMLAQKIRITTPHQYRYYMNTCTHGYSAVWWDWARWEREIDWMALNGIVNPLMFTGQEKIWQEVYDDLGVSTDGFFTGPAFLPWNRMGNIDDWAGPLPTYWQESQLRLAGMIIARERQFGMRPILPAFAGYVPPKFNVTFPNAKVVHMGNWGAFPGTYYLNPLDDMFQKVGSMFIQKLTTKLGTDHLYNADPFNEETPSTNDTTYLTGVGKSIYSSMTAIDPEATWVMQAWFLITDPFWKPEQAKALLNAMPQDRLLMLDLYAEVAPAWSETANFYNHSFVWNMLLNFGGRPGLYAKLPDVNTGIITALTKSDGHMKGVGLSMEAIDNNPVAYELVTDMIWRTETVDLDNWIDLYAKRRYGQHDDNTSKAWKILKDSVYSCQNDQSGPSGSVIAARPDLNLTQVSFAPLKLFFDPKDLIQAWGLLLASASKFNTLQTYRYDIIDVTLQCMSVFALNTYYDITAAFRAKDIAMFREKSELFREIILDMDDIANTDANFMLGPWTSAARTWGSTQDEVLLMESNARLLVTTWESPKWYAWEYAYRLWGGLILDFYLPRWDLFFDECLFALHQNKDFNKDRFHNRVVELEWTWVYGTWDYPTKPTGNTLDIATKLYNKYH